MPDRLPTLRQRAATGLRLQRQRLCQEHRHTLVDRDLLQRQEPDAIREMPRHPPGRIHRQTRLAHADKTTSPENGCGDCGAA
ncbi:MAG: hypothetical protein IPJ58_13315 [Ardenticatenia bacterium]|nr:hypothetical protein [Ardenticatenia bacterium]